MKSTSLSLCSVAVLPFTLAGNIWAGQNIQDAVHVIPVFTFENGATLQNMKVGYSTWGKLNAEGTNAVLVTHGSTGTRKSFDRYIGPRKAFDTDTYFVIAVDAIGGGLSSAPSDGMGMDFPQYTIRDMVKAQYDLVTNGLHLQGLLAVGGPSMGSFQVLEWGIHHPDFMKGLICIFPGARSPNNFKAIVDAMIATVQLDPAWQGGRYAKNPVDGLRCAGMIFAPWLRSHAFFQSLKSNEEYQAALMVFADVFAAWDARNWMYRFLAGRGHDVSLPFGGNTADALTRIRAKTLIMPSASDRLLPPEMSRELQMGIKDTRYAEIPSILGHLACFPADDSAPEYVFLTKEISEFLKDLPR